MSVATVAVQQATIRQYAKDLKLATVGGQFLSMAEEAVKQKQGHLSYLEALLGAEVEDRYQHGVARRITDAHFPKVKTLEDFAFSDAPHLPAAQIRNLAEGGYLSRSEPVIFLGETGTGKTHMATGLAIAACRQRKRVRFTTAAQLVNELTEAKNKSELNRVTNRWMRYELIVIDEMAYVAMPEAAAELLFQIIAGRAERAAVIVTTNLPFTLPSVIRSRFTRAGITIACKQKTLVRVNSFPIQNALQDLPSWLPELSLGVITMGIRHMTRVQAALDHALEEHPEIGTFFDPSSGVGFLAGLG
jgi:DNA replication protein DnaC